MKSDGYPPDRDGYGGWPVDAGGGEPDPCEQYEHADTDDCFLAIADPFPVYP